MFALGASVAEIALARAAVAVPATVAVVGAGEVAAHGGRMLRVGARPDAPLRESPKRGGGGGVPSLGGGEVDEAAGGAQNLLVAQGHAQRCAVLVARHLEASSIAAKLTPSKRWKGADELDFSVKGTHKI